jgi:tetratricopeptide (TPR) repeat protein
MMLYKTIIQGRLEFGNQKSFDTVSKVLLQRIETYYKTDLIFKYEEIFNIEEFSMEIPRFVNQVSEKSYRNTTDLIKFCSQYAIAGSVRAWLIVDGEIKKFDTIEPKGDKGAIIMFEKGRGLVKQKGKEKEAIDALSQAIEKYDRHAQAYERRAKVNFLMRNYHDALRDYNKCIGIDHTIPTAYYGIAKIHILREEWIEAIENLDTSIKRSIALQTLHWKSRRLKAQCHLVQKEWDKAAFELKLFAGRKFEQDNPNKQWHRWAHYHYASVLVELGKYDEAVKAADIIPMTSPIEDGIQESDILTIRGIAKLKAGKSGHIKDLKEAATLGSLKAENILAEIKKSKAKEKSK